MRIFWKVKNVLICHTMLWLYLNCRVIDPSLLPLLPDVICYKLLQLILRSHVPTFTVPVPPSVGTQSYPLYVVWASYIKVEFTNNQCDERRCLLKIVQASGLMMDGKTFVTKNLQVGPLLWLKHSKGSKQGLKQKFKDASLLQFVGLLNCLYSLLLLQSLLWDH